MFPLQLAISKFLQKGWPDIAFLVGHHSLYQLPVSVFNVDTGTLEKDYTTTDLYSIVDQISLDFNIEKDRIVNYFSRTKYASLSKQVFYRIDFGLQQIARGVGLSATVMKVVKANGIYTVNCRYVGVEGLLQPAKFARPGDLVPNTDARIIVPDYQPLTSEQIIQVYNMLYKKIEDQFNAYKAI
ncbi:hypothetical protein TVAG_253390 [Trichomonas vaginalis G3]|uniref:Uncharacterized protein n=1 Tax=Trichomonas vaginalis (strain ATCC PRA-98 / G3) TaxID=412133 RepID=A2GJ86_TRIV3|nr:hypothetical protein TVAGG3_0301670 [Trichomonas vaginalis G3]EAX82781.1 hypothetical protein TVAG_253390 [Trichomonas vaginalis G3]KAI5527936.1 hypothetical protein TVAGG3_0301670 [Trichomonas vaginalis G3]|eukprot:XP_001295711.1 hypothetical protein [Trichomonas vaginalis G3]